VVTFGEAEWVDGMSTAFSAGRDGRWICGALGGAEVRVKVSYG